MKIDGNIFLRYLRMDSPVTLGSGSFQGYQASPARVVFNETDDYGIAANEPMISSRLAFNQN